MSVFVIFREFVKPYTFLKLKSTARGFEVEQEIEAEGIAKLIEGKTESDNMEQSTSDAVIKVKYSETFAAQSMVGQGIKLSDHQGGRTYRIEGQSLAQDRDFYNLSLVREEFAWPAEESLLPLE